MKILLFPIYLLHMLSIGKSWNMLLEHCLRLCLLCRPKWKPDAKHAERQIPRVEYPLANGLWTAVILDYFIDHDMADLFSMALGVDCLFTSTCIVYYGLTNPRFTALDHYYFTVEVRININSVEELCLYYDSALSLFCVTWNVDNTYSLLTLLYSFFFIRVESLYDIYCTHLKIVYVNVS